MDDLYLVTLMVSKYIRLQGTDYTKRYIWVSSKLQTGETTHQTYSIFMIYEFIKVEFIFKYPICRVRMFWINQSWHVHYSKSFIQQKDTTTIENFLGQYKCVCNCILYISANSRAKELKAINFSLSAFLTYNNAKSRSKAVFKREPMSSMLKSIFSVLLFFFHSRQ